MRNSSAKPPNHRELGRDVQTFLLSFKVYLEPSCLRMLALGFSAGLPLLLVLGTLSFRLREAGIDRATIGFLSWVGLAYAFKWCWAPLVDRLPIPWLTAKLGRRRSWLLVAQFGVALGLLGMGLAHPQNQLNLLVVCAVLVAASSATQDIALDAYRIESAHTNQQAALAATKQTRNRLAMIWSGAGVLGLAALAETATTMATAPGVYQQTAWFIAYAAMAASMAVGVLTVLLSPEPSPPDGVGPVGRQKNLTLWLKVALLEPFAEFWRRHRWHAVVILALIGVYRISDVVMGIMANPFYVDMGYTKAEVATVTKLYGVIMTLGGAFLGGALVIRLGTLRVLMLGAVLSSATNVLFAWLSTRGHDVQGLIAVVSADNLASGIASAAFIAYLSGLTHVHYSATQYALFSSMMLLVPKWLAGFSGVVVDAHGYPLFFMGTALLGLPVLGLVAWVGRLSRQ